MKISFVIPCYGSEKTLEGVIKEIKEKISVMGKYDYEIILINDNSPDKVFSKITELCKKDKKIKGISLSKNFGQHSALMVGYGYVTGDIIISLDDDGQAPVESIGELVDKINDGYDVVFGAFFKKKHNVFRNFGSHINDIMAEYLLSKPKKLKVTSFFAAKRYIIDEIVKYKNPYPYVLGLILRVTKNICNVYVHHREREEGKSGYTFIKLISLWMNGFTAFSVKPLRIATFLGVCSAFIGFVFAIYTIVQKLTNPKILLGYSSLMAVLLFLGGMIMVMLGLIGEYIGRIYISINNSPQYVVKDIINLESNEVKNE